MTATRPNAVAAASASEIREQVAEAAARGRTLRIVGGGTWLDANRPVRADSTLAVGTLAGIVEYEPGDLTLTARAGTTLSDIARATAAHGQWLALDPVGDPARASIGATIATASYGPLAHQFGTPRDMTLGVEFVTGTGVIARGGGRVVKNVAGFDLTRLMTGSWGTLAVLTEVTVRLRARPAVETTILLPVEDTPERVEAMRRSLRALPFTPLAAQWLDVRLAREVGVDASTSVVLVRLGGNEEAIRAQCTALEPLGSTREVGLSVWDRLRVAEPIEAASFRLSRRPSEFAQTWLDAKRLVNTWPGAYCHGDAGRGGVRCVLPLVGPDSDARLRAVTDVPFAGTRIFERLPEGAWANVPGALRLPLQHRVKSAFDPRSILNPGILGEKQ